MHQTKQSKLVSFCILVLLVLAVCLGAYAANKQQFDIRSKAAEIKNTFQIK